MSDMVKFGNTRDEQIFSAAHPIADIEQRYRLVGFVPISDVMDCAVRVSG